MGWEINSKRLRESIIEGKKERKKGRCIEFQSVLSFRSDQLNLDMCVRAYNNRFWWGRRWKWKWDSISSIQVKRNCLLRTRKMWKATCVCQSIKSFSEIFFLTKYSSIKQSNSHFAGFFTKIIYFLCAAVFPTYCCSVSFVNEKC